MNYYVYLSMFLFSTYLFCYYYDQVLLTLLMLEFVMLSMTLFMSLILTKLMCMYLFMYYIVIMVCESVLGLTLLVLLVRTYGNDKMKTMNLILW